MPLLPQVREAIEAYAAACPYGVSREAPLFRDQVEVTLGYEVSPQRALRAWSGGE